MSQIHPLDFVRVHLTPPFASIQLTKQQSCETVMKLCGIFLSNNNENCICFVRVWGGEFTGGKAMNVY